MAATRKRAPAPRLSHVDPRGRVQMVDVSAKPETEREAVAEASIRMSAAARPGHPPAARQEGRSASDGAAGRHHGREADGGIIPLCHPLPLSHVDVDLRPTPRGYAIRARAATVGRTGVEMEALVAASVAALTLYDMLKAVDRAMVIGPVRLLEKRGGRSGHYRRR